MEDSPPSLEQPGKPNTDSRKTEVVAVPMAVSSAARAGLPVHRAKNLKKILRDIFIALGSAILTLMFEVATMHYTAPEKAAQLKADPGKLLELAYVPFDLWLIALSLMLGGAEAIRKGPGRSKWAIILPAVAIIGMLASLQFAEWVPAGAALWCRVYVPDLLAVGLMGFAMYAVLE